MRKPILASYENGETESEGEAEADGYGYRYGDAGEGEDGDGDGHEDDEERETRLSSESCSLSIAVKELRSIKFHLYSAAEFCETTYMSSTQKKTVYDNLKEYSVKAIINAVDHFNTIAFKIDETFSQCVNDITVLQVNTSSLARGLSLNLYPMDRRLVSVVQAVDRSSLNRKAFQGHYRHHHSHSVMGGIVMKKTHNLCSE